MKINTFNLHYACIYFSLSHFLELFWWKEIGLLVSLYQLTLRENYLEGQLPSELGDLSMLDYSNFHKNCFTGMYCICSYCVLIQSLVNEARLTMFFEFSIVTVHII